MEEFNSWWLAGKVDEDLALPFKRPIYFEVERSLERRFILALVGLRRTGKTTILYQIIQKLIKDKIDPSDILFFSFDELTVSIDDVINSYKEIHLKDFRQKRVYVFLDEIQKCQNWENELKKYYDLYPKMKFLISGSESLFIRKKTKETLAGRIFEFASYPFSFREYLEIHNVMEKYFKYETKIRPFFLRYMLKGGFPEMFSLEKDSEIKDYIRTLVVDKIIYKDIPKIFNIDDPEFLITILELISSNPGMYLEYQSLSKQFGKDRRVIRDYIIYLKESFLVRLLGNYRRGSTTLRKLKKAYPADNALIFLYKSGADEAFFGKMMETAVVNKIRAISFWKNSGEVDIIAEGYPIEVKYQEKINSSDIKPMRNFMRKFNTNEGLVITKNDEKKIRVEEGIIKLIPAWKWFLL